MAKKYLLLQSLFLSLCLCFSAIKSYAITLHVIDWNNLAKNAAILHEAVNQTRVQLQTYQLMLEQSKQTLKNMAKPDRYILDDIEGINNNIALAMNSLQAYKKKLGGMKNFLKLYMSLPDYEKLDPNKPNYRKLISEHREFTKTITKATNEDVLRTAVEQQEGLHEDTKKLEELQTAIKEADGNLKAISYTNQLIAQQNSQIMKLRSALLAQQAAQAAKSQAEADEKAQQEARSKKINDMSGWEPYDGPSAWLDF